MTAEVNISDFGFPVFDLSGATAAGGELSPLRFDRTEYTPLERFVENLHGLPDKPIRVSNRTLSVHGRVVSDNMEKYLAARGESSSALREVLKTPRHYLVYKNQELRPYAPHFELGSFVHSAFLEPNKFKKVRVEPKANEATNDGLRTLVSFYWELLGHPTDAILSELRQQALRDKLRELRAAAAQAGYTIITEEWAGIIEIIRKTYVTYGGGILPRLFAYCKPETSIYGRDEDTGLPVKIRPDALLLEENAGINAIVSFKTTSASGIEAFMRDCAKYRYELSEGMYLDVASAVTGRPFTATIMVMVQTVLPYQVALIYWDAEDLQVGKYKYRQAMDIVRQCRAADSWPGFDSRAEEGSYGIIQGKLPDYIKSELMPQYLPQ